jgi:O-antigen ligase
MRVASWREAVLSPGFAQVDFWITAIGGGVLCLFPEVWLWCLSILLIPRVIRVAARAKSIRPQGNDWLLAVFLVSACAGYWAAYDREAASTKLMFLAASILLYYAIRAQPEVNLAWISSTVFCIGVGVSVYFFLTHDFIESPRKLEFVNAIGRRIMQIRPSMGWEPIHPNYVSGIAAITSPFIIYPFTKLRGRRGRWLLQGMILIGLALVGSALIMATSRGILLAVASAAGVWVLWRFVPRGRINSRLGNETFFPFLVILFLIAVAVILYLGPAGMVGSAADSVAYGQGTRAEVFARSAYLVADFPFTGGGLGAYPALYSQYLLAIPYFYLPNAHNLFLDVFIEQGIPGGLAFLLLYAAGIWQAALAVIRAETHPMRVFSWIALAVLVVAFIHGLVDDYLYYGRGSILALVPLAVAVIPGQPRSKPGRTPRWFERQAAQVVAFGMAGLLILNLGQLKSAWYSNLGAVQMARVELKGFPTGQWAGADLVPALATAETSLIAAVEVDPTNRTANHRLGLIAMLHQDFSTAAEYLKTANAQAPGHRGIMKALGYCYIWLGEYNKAQIQLAGIPEAANELDAYVWWWQVQGRSDLSERASAMRSKLYSRNGMVQP